MSEKQLSKSAWEAQAKKFKVDEKALSKALAAFEKCDAKDHAGREEALKGVEKAAEGLKKDKEYKEAAGYLGEVLAAVKSARKEIEEEAGEDEGEEDEESAAYKKDLAKQLKSALSQVKARAPGEPGAPTDGSQPEPLKFMAYVAGGGSAVIVAKKVGGSVRKLVASISKASGGKYLSGDCIFEKNAYTFVLDQPPGGLAHKLSAALLEETGQKYKVRVRSADGLTVMDDETDAVEGGPSPTAAPALDEAAIMAHLKTLKADLDKVVAGAAPSANEAKAQFIALATMVKQHLLAKAGAKLPELEAVLQKALQELAGSKLPPAELEAAFKQRLAALLPKVKDAIAANAPTAQELRLKFSEAGASAKQHDFAKAGALLDEIEALLAGGHSTDDEALFKQRLAALMPKIKDSIASGAPVGQTIRLKAAEAGAFAKQHDFAKGNATLSEIEILLGAPSPSTGAGKGAEPGKPFSLVALQKSRLVWDDLRKSIQRQLQEMETAIMDGVRAHNEDETAEDEFEEGEVGTAVKKLYTILDALDQRLIDKLDEALNAQTDADRQARHDEAAKIVKEYQATAAASPLLSVIDTNGFTKSTIRDAVNTALKDLAAQF